MDHLLLPQVPAVAPRHLPEPGQPRTNAVPQLLKIRAELLDMVVWEWPWPDQAHIAEHDIP